MLTSSDQAIVLPILRSIGAHVYLVDVRDDGTFRYFAVNWQQGTNSVLPYTGSVVGRRPEDIFDPGIAKGVLSHYQQCVQQRGQVQFEASYEAPAGKGWINHILTPLFDLTGQIVRIMGTVIDITPQKRAEAALQESMKRFRSFYEDTPARMMTLDPDGTILSINTFCVEQTGYSRSEMINTSIFDHIAVEDRRRAMESIERAREEPGKLHHAEFRAVNKDGTVRWTRNSMRATEMVPGNKVILTVSQDATEAHELAEDLEYQASHDWLTGLVNRRHFESRLQSMIDGAIAGKGRHALCYLDLDQFKIINDTFGHVAGDDLLRQIGVLLQENVSEQDILARLGGDEFGIVAVDRTIEEAERMGRDLCRTVERYPFTWQNHRFNIGVSIGIAAVDQYCGGVINVLRAADRACYAAKDKGRNRVHVYSEHDPDLKKRIGELEWVNRIHHALAEGRFRLYFQPIVPINDRDRGLHFEILLRMEDEPAQADEKVIGPDIYLPAAEHYNVTGKIDRWVVETTFRWLHGRPEQLEQLHLCAINLAGTSLEDDVFMNAVIKAFEDIPIPAEKICFEITETAAVKNFSATMRFIRVFRERGCRFSLDDFGTGMSCFRYLTNLPVDFLKIDGSFIQDIVDNPVSRAIVRSTTEIGHIMNKKIIAEFVENQATLEILREMGVDYCQGHLMGRPGPVP